MLKKCNGQVYNRIPLAARGNLRENLVRVGSRAALGMTAAFTARRSSPYATLWVPVFHRSFGVMRTGWADLTKPTSYLPSALQEGGTCCLAEGRGSLVSETEVMPDVSGLS